MYSKALLESAVLLALTTVAVHSQATPANQPLVAPTDIEGIIPTNILSPAVVSHVL